MRHLFRGSMAASVLLMLIAVAWTQPPAGRFQRGLSAAMLFRQESVQKELRLNGDQLKKVEELLEKMREKMQNAVALEEPERGKKVRSLNQEIDKALAAILTSEQVKRLKQIVYQQQGIAALATADVAKVVGISDAQLKQIADIIEETDRKTRELRRPGAPRDEAARTKIEGMRKAAHALPALPSSCRSQFATTEGRG